MALYAYADESIFEMNPRQEETALGYGMFISQTKISPEIISSAQSQLKQDTDFDIIKDTKTLRHNYFHASEDSKNAHSYLCHAINNHVEGIFDYTFINKLRHSDIKTTKLTEKVFNRCLNGSALELFLTRDEIFLTIERRDSFNEHHAKSWLSQIQHLYEGVSYNTPSYKTFFPKINIELKGKNEPGLQVVDFLIWSANRTKRINPDNTWHKRIKYKTWYQYQDKGNQNREKFYLNFLPNDEGEHDYPFKFSKPKEWNDFLNAYINIERLLVSIGESDFKESNIHLFEDFNEISLKLKEDSYHLKGDDIRKVGSVYLRLFDTLPIYQYIKNHDKKSWSGLFHAKYLASMFVRNDMMNFGRTQDAIQRWRHDMVCNKNELFQKLIKG